MDNRLDGNTTLLFLSTPSDLRPPSSRGEGKWIKSFIACVAVRLPRRCRITVWPASLYNRHTYWDSLACLYDRSGNSSLLTTHFQSRLNPGKLQKAVHPFYASVGSPAANHACLSAERFTEFNPVGQSRHFGITSPPPPGGLIPVPVTGSGRPSPIITVPSQGTHIALPQLGAGHGNFSIKSMAAVVTGLTLSNVI